MTLESAEDIGERLLRLGWRQGSTFTRAGLRYDWNDHASLVGTSFEAETRYIVISQDCDITASPPREPFIEVLACETRDRAFCRQVKNSARYFVIDPHSNLVAFGSRRVHVRKEVVVGWKIEPLPWASSADHFTWFRRWLALRYDRPPMPDPLVERFANPLDELIKQLDKRMPEAMAHFDGAVRQIRISRPDSETPPFRFRIFFYLEHPSLTPAETTAIDIIADAIADRFPPDHRAEHGIDIDDIQNLAPNRASVDDYFRTWPIYLEYRPYAGEEVSGAEPYPRA